MEHHNYDSGVAFMCRTNGFAIDVRLLVILGYRLLYVLQFIAIVVTMGWLQSSLTLGFLGASFCILYSVISAKKELFAPWDFSYLLEEYKDS